MLLFHQPLLCFTYVLFPSIQPIKIVKYFHIHSTKNSISILFYYFINISYSSFVFDNCNKREQKIMERLNFKSSKKNISNKREQKIMLNIGL